MVLGSWMRMVGLSDREMAEKVGGMSVSGIRKLRYRQRGPSIRVAARIVELSAGKVTLADMQPIETRASTSSVAAEGVYP
ncbi:hypothetical protein [Methylobacterium sp. J-090]|uniref:hypothetical protein n=1 Tax=Methylobacterium sp. J-090 TaxID=2836666 RepID=UPI001FBA3122|nr:hypothetical protein [Methylobacterium sp. J-090]MCJ2080727.1 hypothetical protein [Methylobacterium sp. J-090]